MNDFKVVYTLFIFLVIIKGLEKGKTTLVILETLVANGVSSLMPFGNPQNIFIYYYYNVHPLEFIKTIAPFSFISLGLKVLGSGVANLPNLGL